MIRHRNPRGVSGGCSIVAAPRKKRFCRPCRQAREPGSAAFSIELRLEVSDLRPPLRRWLVPRLRRLAVRAGVRRGAITLTLVGDARMKELHQRYMGLPTTTDVLTFDLSDSPGKIVEGDIIICADQARRQARLRGRAARLEVLLYSLHGLMHLIGYDDVTSIQSARMHRQEDEWLTQAGFGALFSGG